MSYISRSFILGYTVLNWYSIINNTLKRGVIIDYEEITESLCYHDRRNPNYIEVKGRETNESCYCGNCFYGRTKLARELLK